MSSQVKAKLLPDGTLLLAVGKGHADHEALVTEFLANGGRALSGDDTVKAVAKRAISDLRKEYDKTTALLPTPMLNGTVQKTSGPHKYASTQFNLIDGGYTRTQGGVIPHLQAMQDRIADEDLAGDGKEDQFHATVIFRSRRDHLGSDEPVPNRRARRGQGGRCRQGHLQVEQADRGFAALRQRPPDVQPARDIGVCSQRCWVQICWRRHRPRHDAVL